MSELGYTTVEVFEQMKRDVEADLEMNELMRSVLIEFINSTLAFARNDRLRAVRMERRVSLDARDTQVSFVVMSTTLFIDVLVEKGTHGVVARLAKTWLNVWEQRAFTNS